MMACVRESEWRRAAWSAAVALGLMGAGCVKNSATGKNIFTLGMSRSQQISLGADAARQFTDEFGGQVQNEPLQSYVREIGAKMAAQTEGENPTLPWEFTLLNTPMVNAFALPGGKVFFTRGLAEKLTSEAQMAGVIGHEIGHVTAEHGAQRIASQTAFNVGIAVGAVLVESSEDKKVRNAGRLVVPAVAIAGNIVLLKYGRDEELEADRLGVRYMSKVGYNPRGQREVMEVLASLSKGGSTPEFLSTHPNPLDRVAQVDRLLQTDYAFTQNNPNFGDFSDRYQRQFLSVVKLLPPAPKPKQPEGQGAAGGRMRWIEPPPTAFAAHDPTTWCATCMTVSTDNPNVGGMLGRAALARARSATNPGRGASAFAD
jgi:predicted Zn-dependent protease